MVTEAGISPGRHMRQLRVAIFEPNISVVKTSSIPMLVCDEAYRSNRIRSPALACLPGHEIF
jgi:hypothetical protein